MAASKYPFKLIACALAGVGLMIAGIYRFTENDRFLARSYRATGIIERIDQYLVHARGGARYPFRRPYVKFWTNTGKVIEFAGPGVPESEATFHVGQEIEVAYLSNSPDEARIPSLYTEAKDASWLFILGLVISTGTALFV
jgi:hypothetical protein